MLPSASTSHPLEAEDEVSRHNANVGFVFIYCDLWRPLGASDLLWSGDMQMTTPPKTDPPVWRKPPWMIRAEWFMWGFLFCLLLLRLFDHLVRL